MKNNIVKFVIAIVVIGVLVGFNMLMNNNTNVKHEEGEDHEHSEAKVLDATLEMDKVCIVETTAGNFEFVLMGRDIPLSTKAIKKVIRKKGYNDVPFIKVESWVAETDFAKVDMTPLENERSYGVDAFRGAVVLAKGNKTMKNVSSLCFIKECSPSMNEYFTIIGFVINGMDVVDKIKDTDSIKNIKFRKSTKEDETKLIELVKQGKEDALAVQKVSMMAEQMATQGGMPH